jgi:hydrogenase maturation protease
LTGMTTKRKSARKKFNLEYPEKLKDLKNNFLVLGIGNLLLKDESAGIHVVKQLENEGFSGADLLDGGTGGFSLLGIIKSYKHVIITDASFDRYRAGHIRVLHPKYAKDFPHRLSAHEIGLKDLIDAAFLLGNAPDIWLVTISVKDFRKIDMELTPEVEKAIPVAAEKVKEIIKSLNE